MVKLASMFALNQSLQMCEVLFPQTKKIRTCDTVIFFPTTIPFPQVKSDDFLRQAAEDIISILTQPPSTVFSSLQAGNPTRNALILLAE